MTNSKTQQPARIESGRAITSGRAAVEMKLDGDGDVHVVLEDGTDVQVTNGTIAVLDQGTLRELSHEAIKAYATLVGNMSKNKMTGPERLLWKQYRKTATIINGELVVHTDSGPVALTTGGRFHGTETRDYRRKLRVTCRQLSESEVQGRNAVEIIGMIQSQSDPGPNEVHLWIVSRQLFGEMFILSPNNLCTPSNALGFKTLALFDGGDCTHISTVELIRFSV